MTAVWLLPVVSTIVAAASGGIVAEMLPNPQHALWTLITSYILWGTGVPLAMVILVMYFHRLTVHRLPPREVIVSVFLPLGPLGQGGFGIMQLGKVALQLFPKTGSLIEDAGKVLYVVGFGLALIMWGYGLVWFFFALASISRTKFPFNMVRLATSNSIKSQHSNNTGLVGFHFPHRSLRCQYQNYRSGAAKQVFQSPCNGMPSLIHTSDSKSYHAWMLLTPSLFLRRSYP